MTQFALSIREPWSPHDIGDQEGSIVLITGGNSGIGLEAARTLATAGATVILGCRDMAKGQRSAAEIRAGHRAARVELLEVDLADLTSVEHAAKTIKDRHDHLDVLCNNAGVMATPYRQTVDGFELQFGTNHLGHFALTGQLLEMLLAAQAPRVVTVASGMHRFGAIEFDNLDCRRGYRKWRRYSMSKLANLLFAFELQRRCDAAGLALRSVAAHPGYAHTGLQTAGPEMSDAKLYGFAMGTFSRLVGQPAEAGALPTLYAAVGRDVDGGDYVGPDGFFELRGHPVKVPASRGARNLRTAARLWAVSEELTGVRYTSLLPA